MTAHRRREILLMGSALFVVLLLTLLSLPSIGWAQDAESAGPDHRDGPVLVVLDTSSSMSDSWANTSTAGAKIDAARSTITQVVQGLPPGSDFGLIAYPGAGSTDSSGCSIGEEEVPIGPLDQTAAAAAVRRLQPSGDTPTAPALRHAAERLTLQGGYGTIILVSDGESNCGAEEVCDVAKDLGQSGVSLQVNTVGLQISQTGREELECVAAAGNGQYLSADDEDALTAVIGDLAGARLDATASVPESMSAVAGSGSSGATVSATVTASGQYRSDDVRVSLRFDRAGLPGSVTVPRPVIFLGNLEPGEMRTVTFVVRPDDRSVGEHEWFVNATASNASARELRGRSVVTADPDVLSGVLAGIDRAIVVGDSYSSGEGIGSYMPGTTGLGRDNACHRSDRAYGARLFGPRNTTMIACSGAVTADFYGMQESGSLVTDGPKPRMRPQLETLRSAALASRSPTAVFLSVGGNDSGFGDFAKQCIGIRCGDITVAPNGDLTTFTARIAAITNSVLRVYRDVDRAVNDPVAQQARGGTTAPIVVVPYPRLVPRSGGVDCQFGITADEIPEVNRFIDFLNQVIQNAVSTVWLERRPVYFASDVIESFQPDHTICDAEPFATAAPGAGGTAVGAATKELLHPNDGGHGAMARAIAAWSSAATVRPSSGPAAAWTSSVAQVRNGLSSLSYRVMSRARAYEAGAPAQVDANGFAPTSTVVFRLESVPFVLGSGDVREDGTVSSDVTIPDGVPAGRHTVIASGLGEDGQLVEHRYSVVVGPVGSGPAATGVIAGVVILALSAWGFRATRRPVSAPQG